MNTLAKSEPLGTLGLPPGDHWVKFHVEEDTISFEVAASIAAQDDPASRQAAASSFVQKWSGKGQLLPAAETDDDDRLSALTAKHLREEFLLAYP